MTIDIVYCHKSVLIVVSDFFREKISACERMKNCLEFDYTDFDKGTVDFFLDTVYNIKCSEWQLDPCKEILRLLKLVEFLKWEGKNMVSGIVLVVDYNRL